MTDNLDEPYGKRPTDQGKNEKDFWAETPEKEGDTYTPVNNPDLDQEKNERDFWKRTEEGK